MAEIMNNPGFRNILITDYGDNTSNTFVLSEDIESRIETIFNPQFYYSRRFRDLENNEGLRKYFISSLVNVLNQVKTKKLVN